MTVRVDIAIIGGGAAGLSAALSMPARLKVAVFSKRQLADCASARAQGGIAAAVAKEDSVEAHVDDTLRAGDGLCSPEAVRAIVGDAPKSVEWLEQQGVEFNRSAEGLSLAREGGHAARRIAHVDDITGHAIVAALGARAREQKNITISEDFIAVNLYRDGGICRGFYALNLSSGTVEAISARAVLIATGGAGKVYLYSTTPPDATGDGTAMAYRAGCRIANMEFVQFHPTCLFHPQAPSFLISEAVRGEGARLVNATGDFFMEGSNADELSSRDIVARVIDAEMKKTGADCVYLDLSSRPPEFWRERFPTIMRRCESFGLSAERIPVVPAAHYFCGGIQTDVDGHTDLPGLFAAGEAACNGLHGANRLASNSLLECIAGGRRAAAAIIEDLPSAAKEVPEWDERRISISSENITIAHNWDELRRLMWNYVGIARADERLIRARRRIEWIGEEAEEYYRRHAVNRDFLELRNLIQCAALVIEGALSRRESRGLHFNADCPNRASQAVPTVLRRDDFIRRRSSVNEKCPFSGRPVVANGLFEYAGHIVGFCNSQCRDSFAAAVEAEFVGAGDNIIAAREEINARIGGKNA